MSKSFRTQKEAVLAERRIQRAGNVFLYPKITVKMSTKGDIHPLTKRALANLFDSIPVEYLYGLHEIELRGRSNNEIGEPFGLYRRQEKTILLYSLPLEWRFNYRIDALLRSSLLRFHAEVKEEGDTTQVRWPQEDFMTVWFYCYVFTHELGHHFRTQYHHKNGALGKSSHEEWVADLHAERLTDLLFQTHRR